MAVGLRRCGCGEVGSVTLHLTTRMEVNTHIRYCHARVQHRQARSPMEESDTGGLSFTL